MGLDARHVRAVINLGKPTYDWILKQQAGRAGRDGQQAISVNLSCRVRPPKAAEMLTGWTTSFQEHTNLFTRPGVSGAVLQTPS